MISSLNVIDEAEYTFYTGFQDHQYKVTNSPCVVVTNLLLLKLKHAGQIAAGGETSEGMM